MTSLAINDLKYDLGNMLNILESGESIELKEDTGSAAFAIIMPLVNKSTNKRNIGILDGKVNYVIKDNFEMTEEELIGL